MIYIILGLCIILIILGTFMVHWDKYDYEDVGGILCTIGIFIGIVFLIALISCLGCYNATKTTSNSQIKVYEEQNEIVIAQIEPLVEKYLNYEKDTYNNLKVDSNTLVAMSMYPELKGNEFVQSQIKIIIDNQQKITQLKLKKARLNAYKMWIFVGE